MLVVKCFYENGDIVVTAFGGTIDDANQYFVGNTFNIGVEGDDLQKCVRIEFI